MAKTFKKNLLTTASAFALGVGLAAGASAADIAADATVATEDDTARNFTEQVTLTYSDNNSDYGGVITTGTDGEGVLALTAAGITLEAAIGTSTASIAEIDVGAATAQIEADTYAKVIDLSTATVLTVDDASLFADNIIISSNTNPHSEIDMLIDTADGSETISAQIGSSTFALSILDTNGNVSSSTLTLTGANNYINDIDAGVGTIVLNGNILRPANDTDGVEITFNTSVTTGDGNVDVGDGVTIDGLVTAADVGDGDLRFLGSAVVTSTIGASHIGSIDLDTAEADDIVEVQGSTVDADVIKFTDDATLKLSGTATALGANVTTAITTGTDGEGTIEFAGGGRHTTPTGQNIGVETTGQLKAVNVSGSGATLVVGANLYTDSMLLSNGAAVEFTGTGAEDFHATVTTATDNTGAINFIGTATVEGDLGSSSAKLLQVSFGDSATVEGTDITASTVILDNTATILTLNDGSDITAAITSDEGNAITGRGTLRTSGGHTFNGQIGSASAMIGTLDLDADVASKTVTFNDDIYTDNWDSAGMGAATAIVVLDEDVTVNVDENIAAGATGSETITFNFDDDSNASIKLGKASSTANFASITVGAAVDNPDDYVAAGARVIIETEGDVTIPAATATVTETDYIFDYTFAQSSDTNDVELTITRANPYNAATTNETNDVAVGAALETIGAANSEVGKTTETALQAIFGRLDATQTVAADANQGAQYVTDTLETLTPKVDGGNVIALNNVQNQALATVSDRLASVRLAEQGIATGGAFEDNAVWVQGFGGSADQDDRDGVRGYTADSYGFAIGGDTQVNDRSRVGIAFSYANTDVDSYLGDSDIDTYQATVYADYDAGDWYAEGLIGVGFNDYETTRTTYGTSGVASGDSDGLQYTVKVEGGYRLPLDGGLNLTPVGSLQYTHVDQDDYTETGSTSTTPILTVNPDDISKFEIGLGAKVDYPITDGGITYVPELRAKYVYDIVGDEVETTSNFVGVTGTSFKTQGFDAQQHSFNFGAGLAIHAQNNITVSFDYDLEAKADYDAHTGAIKAKFAF